MALEIQPGDPVPEVHLTVEAEPMKLMTLLTADPNPIHFNTSVVERLGLGNRRINQGALNLAYALNAALGLVDGDPGRLSATRFRFLGQVFEGDEVVAGGIVTAVDFDAGTATLSLWVDVLGGDRALEGSATIRLADDGRREPA